ncbi:hypothetical protein, partial [Bacillus cereus]
MLNNEITIQKDGFFQLEKDKEAVVEFEKEVKEKLITFKTVEEKIRYLL